MAPIEFISDYTVKRIYERELPFSVSEFIYFNQKAIVWIGAPLYYFRYKIKDDQIYVNFKHKDRTEYERTFYIFNKKNVVNFHLLRNIRIQYGKF